MQQLAKSRLRKKKSSPNKEFISQAVSQNFMIPPMEFIFVTGLEQDEDFLEVNAT